MSENEDNYQSYAAGVPMDEPKATEESLYEFDSATFTTEDPVIVVEAIEPEPAPEPEPTSTFMPELFASAFPFPFPIPFATECAWSAACCPCVCPCICV